MSEVQTRPAATRGRGSGRGGRGGGLSTRGGSRNGAPNGDAKHDTDSSLPTLEDEGEVGQLKKLYGSKVELIKEIVPDWSEVDILFALRETDGDESLAVTRIAEGKLASCSPSLHPRCIVTKLQERSPACPSGFAFNAAMKPPNLCCRMAADLFCHSRNHRTMGRSLEAQEGARPRQGKD